MAKRRRTVQHLWNRFMAAVLFVLGAALSTVAPGETQETRVSKAGAAQLEAAAHIGRQPASTLSVRRDGAGNDGPDDQPALATPLFTLADRAAGQPSAISTQPARRANRPPRDGDSRAPPSA
jgi:hypothetical protein